MAIEALSNPSSVFNSQQSYTSAQNTAGTQTAVQTQPADSAQADDTAKDTSDQGRYEVENVSAKSREQVKQAVDEINKKIRPTHTSCQFSYHEETNRISIKVIDDDNGKVIREIPPEKTLDMIAKTLELEGILVDEKR